MFNTKLPKCVGLTASQPINWIPSELTNLKWEGNDNMDGWVAKVDESQISKSLALKLKKFCALDDDGMVFLYADHCHHIHINNDGEVYLHIKA